MEIIEHASRHRNRRTHDQPVINREPIPLSNRHQLVPQDWAGFDHNDAAALIERAAEIVITIQYASAAMLQRNLKISLKHANDCLKILDQLHIISTTPNGVPIVIVSANALQSILALLADCVEIRRESAPSDRSSPPAAAAKKEPGQWPGSS